MKKQTVTLLTFLLAASVFFSSCNNIVSKHIGAFQFDSLQVNETAHLFGDTARPACNLTINLAYVSHSSDEKMQDSLNTYFLSACFGQQYMKHPVQEAVKKYTENYVANYRNDLEPLLLKDEANQEEGASIASWYSYYKGIESHVQLYTKQLLVYRLDYNEYTGGAHGIYLSSFFNIDLRTLVPIHLADIFVEGYEEQLTDLLWTQLMADNKVDTRQELEEMGYATTGELTPTENFYLGDEGITFYYNVYDIAPYVMGATRITLSYETVRHLLQSNSAVTMNFSI